MRKPFTVWVSIYCLRQLKVILELFDLFSICSYTEGVWLASSVDVECNFSGGRCQVNFMQTNMSHDIFKSSMALGSWCNAPFYDIHEAI
ncbi:hypothetical protein BT96DRAFT_822213 [Gymnopus androsaceus JB14]|uniref:Uncharacterized protein n=1 Tax=Gymnopus androsaceus JB14 TaxID=1447944 RepID=A0A6A4HJW0_9AGAR|nr:hypothetical protein BT96DRAFT_822213 [Gymnopus androsaceus JB14]